MKRSHSDVRASMLPVFAQNDPRKVKSSLEGNYELKIIKAVDISKPTAKPVDEIDEPENEDLARENKMNQNSARMIQLTLRDENNTEIYALETERIPELDNVNASWKIHIDGPVEVRCGNIMLERRNVTGKEQFINSEEPAVRVMTLETNNSPELADTRSNLVILDEPDSAAERPGNTLPNRQDLPSHNPQMPEDWDDFDEDDDDCIIIE